MDIIKLYDRALKLKSIKRTGWMYKDIENPESVAEHTFGVSFLATIVPLPDDINQAKLLKMAILHDIGESVVGDIVWENGIHSNKDKQKNKHQKEESAIKELFLEDEELKDLAIEFLECETKTSKFLKEIGKLEMIFQALEYEKKVSLQSLDEFWDNADKYIKDPKLREIFEKLKGKRS